MLRLIHPLDPPTRRGTPTVIRVFLIRVCIECHRWGGSTAVLSLYTPSLGEIRDLMISGKL